LSGLIVESKYYANTRANETATLNMWMKYDEFGKVDSNKGNYVTYKVLGDYDTLRIYSMTPYYGDCLLVEIADFNEYFEEAPGSLDTMYDINLCRGRIPLHGKKRVNIADMKKISDTVFESKPIRIDLEKALCFDPRCNQ